MYTMFTIPFYGALKSLFGEYKFKTLHIRKSLFSALFWYFYTKSLVYHVYPQKITILIFFHIQKITLLPSFNRSKKITILLFFNHSANTHYFWFSTTVSSLLINSPPCILLIIHICIDPQTREDPSYCKSYCIITKIS